LDVEGERRESVPDDRSRDVDGGSFWFVEFRGCRQHGQVSASCRAETGVTKSNDPLIFDPRVVLFRNILTPGHSGDG